MAPIKPQKVISFSSEDPHNPADNLLNRETFRKWRCKEPGEPQASVVLQLDRPYRIDYLDIGNNGSALVEVYVGRSENADQYEVLLPNSSFMTPAEAKSETILHRVRMFGPDKLNKPIQEQKWDRIRIVCSQPFSKSLAYGLSFIDLRNNEPDPPGSSSLKACTDVAPQAFGIFKLRQEPLDEAEPISKGSLFAQRKPSLLGNLSGPAAIRAASSLAANTLTKSQEEKEEEDARLHSQLPESCYYQLKKEQKSCPTGANKGLAEKDLSPLPKRKLVSEEDDDVPPKLPKLRRQKGKDPGPPKKKPEEEKAKRKIGEANKDKITQRHQQTLLIAPMEKEKKSKSFEQLLNGVVFVMSGFQNPLRAHLRDNALAMGARYKPDWGPMCTHLICAFPNTPKFNEVQGQGKIVTKDWIEQCFKQRKRLPWRRFALDRADQGPESEDEIWEVKPSVSPVSVVASNNGASMSKEKARNDPVSTPKKPFVPTLSTQSNFTNGTSVPTMETPSMTTNETVPRQNDEDYGGDTDLEDDIDEEDVYNANTDVEDYGGDTNLEGDIDEYENLVKNESSGEDAYNADTDVEDDDTDVEDDPDPIPASVPRLPDFFEGNYFFVYGNFEAEEQKRLSRHIIAFKGSILEAREDSSKLELNRIGPGRKVEPYMNADVNYVVTDKEPDVSFQDALEENPSILFVKPEWVWVCVEAQKWMSPAQYLITP